MLHLTINGKPIEVPEGTTILEAARMNSIDIPSLCYLKDTNVIGSCRICVVEVKGAKTLQASCVTQAAEGMEVFTNSRIVRESRKVLYELILSDHDKDCLFCKRNQSCELQKLGIQLGVERSRFEGDRSTRKVDVSVSITRDLSKCILCRRCVSVCNKIQQTSVLNTQNRGFKTEVSPAMNLPLGAVNCTFCGQCTVVCPVGALKETSATEKVWAALNDPTRRTVVQVAPAVRVAIGEEFGLPAGTRCTGKLASALKELGFDDVFDTNWAADLTIMEEGTEFLGRVKAALTGGAASLPMITSCSPGWIKYIEHNYPEQLSHLSTCKSPHTMMGAIVKSYFAKNENIDPKDLFVVSVMPCTAKKFEIERPEMQNGGFPNVDAVLTTRELAEMIHSAGIDFATLRDSAFHNPLGLSSGAADIFGVTGGVMEAALRTVYELVTGRELPFDKLHVTPIVGLDQVKDAAIRIEDAKPEYAFLNGVDVRVAVTSGFAGARKLMDQIRAGASPYHFIEIMGCPGGCITGGGQPRSDDPEIRQKRMAALYDEDESKVMRKSHENPVIQKIYAEFLGQPNGHLSHELLHTHYTRRGVYNQMTEEVYVVDFKASPEVKPVYAPAAVGELARARAGTQESPRVMALEAENAMLRAELAETQDTVSVFKRIIQERNTLH
ncbi:MAG: 2Fe-2S iron-sulfur cluster binding domain-containing protein [Clostridiales bacterium]|nr:2Fe-2S iron-sulfur cluster binding domain-containing protein [Clostridiales bacterium]